MYPQHWLLNLLHILADTVKFSMHAGPDPDLVVSSVATKSLLPEVPGELSGNKADQVTRTSITRKANALHYKQFV